MGKGNINIFHWIFVLSIATIICGSTLTDAGAIAAIIGATVAVVLITFGIGRWAYRKYKRSHPFRVKCEGIDNIKAKAEVQHLETTLFIDTELTIEFIQVKFDGDGIKPTIKRLYDWNLLDKDTPIRVYAHPVQDGSWYWEYLLPFRRMAKSRITIGVEYIAGGAFNGSMEIKMISEVSSVIIIPFIVRTGEL